MILDIGSWIASLASCFQYRSVLFFPLRLCSPKLQGVISVWMRGLIFEAAYQGCERGCVYICIRVAASILNLCLATVKSFFSMAAEGRRLESCSGAFLSDMSFFFCCFVFSPWGDMKGLIWKRSRNVSVRPEEARGGGHGEFRGVCTLRCAGGHPPERTRANPGVNPPSRAGVWGCGGWHQSARFITGGNTSPVCGFASLTAEGKQSAQALARLQLTLPWLNMSMDTTAGRGGGSSPTPVSVGGGGSGAALLDEGTHASQWLHVVSLGFSILSKYWLDYIWGSSASPFS